MQFVTYRRRRGPMSRSECEWRVEPDALVTRGVAGRDKRYLWRDFAGVRLFAHPLPNRPWRYVFELQPKHARKIVIDNAHFVSANAYEDRSAAYTPFVRAVTAKLAAENPRLRVLIGETSKRYFFLLIGALIALGLLAYILVAVPTPLDALPFANLIKFAVILAMLPVFWRWVIGSIPKGVPPDAIPARALPPVPPG